MPDRKTMGIYSVIALLFSREPFRFLLAVFALLVGASCELLGLASLLPVATVLFENSSSHIGVASFILSSVGVTQISILDFLVIVIIAISIRGVALYTAYALLGFASARIEEELSTRVVESSIRARWEFILNCGTGRVVDAVTRQAIEAGWLVTLVAPFLTGVILSSILTVCIIYLSPYSFITAAIIGLPLIVCLRTLRTLTSKAAATLIPLNEEKTRRILELNHNAKYIKVAGLGEESLGAIRGLLARIRESNFKLHTYSALVLTAPDTLVVLGVAVLIGIVQGRGLDFGTNFTLSLMLMYRAFQYINQAQGSLLQMRRYFPSITQIQNLAESAEAAREIPIAISTSPIQFEREVAFENITFGYTAGKPILKDFSYSIAKNELILIRGKSGAGKTTLVDLLVGLHSPQAGKITVDGVALDANWLESWRKRIAYIPQDPPIFQGTIRENLVERTSVKADSEIFQALHISCSDELVKDRTDGLNAFIGERGLTISGGQRQRLLIARALLRDVDIIILDEPTSAVDTAGETVLFERMLQHIQGKKTLIAIMHREHSLNFGRILEL